MTAGIFYADQLDAVLRDSATAILDLLSALPGSRVVYKYIRNSHQDDPFRTLLELFLVFFLFWYFLRKKSKPDAANDIKLTEPEIQELIDEWEPEPLVAPLTDFEKSDIEKVPVIQGSPGLKIKLSDGKERLNFSSFNFLGFMNDERIKEKAISALRTYGVGSCGPPGFYGTIDVHMQLEEALARFVQVDSAIIYSQGFSCISSAIPAFAKRGDIIVADESVCLAIQKGLQISRSNVIYFKHNDMNHLESVLKALGSKEVRWVLTFVKKTKKPVRKFIVVEGVYLNTGDICPLPKLVELKEKFKYRLIVEESISLGTLGSRGAGVTDHFGIQATKVDIIAASLCNAIGAAGGFCAGSHEIIHHQRLSGQAYTFSASLPAILAVTGIETLGLLSTDYEKAHPKLLENVATMFLHLKQIGSRVHLTGGEKGSPIIHLRLASRITPRVEEEKILQEVVDLCIRDGVLVVRAKYVEVQEHQCPDPSIRLAISAGHTKRDVERAGLIIRDSMKKILKRYGI